MEPGGRETASSCCPYIFVSEFGCVYIDPHETLHPTRPDHVRCAWRTGRPCRQLLKDGSRLGFFIVASFKIAPTVKANEHRQLIVDDLMIAS